MFRLLILGLIGVVGMTPSVAGAQSNQPAAPPVEKSSNPSNPDPQRHLASAERRLEDAASIPLSEDATKKMSQLREDFKKLMEIYSRRSPSTGRSASGVATGTQEQKAGDWSAVFSDVERDLVAILGGGSSLSPTSTTAVGTVAGAVGAPITAGASTTLPAGTNGAAAQGGGTAIPSPQSAAGSAPAPPATADARDGVANGSPTAAGAPPTGSSPVGTGTPTAGAPGSPTPAATSGTAEGAGSGASNVSGSSAIGLAGVAVSEIGVKNLDPKVRAELEQVRTSVELFYDAATRIFP